MEFIKSLIQETTELQEKTLALSKDTDVLSLAKQERSIHILLGMKEFQLVTKLDPSYGARLAQAWKGDLDELERKAEDPKFKFDSLALKVLAIENIKKFSPKRLAGSIEAQHAITVIEKYAELIFNAKKSKKSSYEGGIKFESVSEAQEKKVTKKAKKPIPKMEFPGCRVDMLEGWKTKLPKAIKELGYDIEAQGYSDGSTAWSVSFHIDKSFNIDDFEDKLRDKLQMNGWMRVGFFDLVEE